MVDSLVPPVALDAEEVVLSGLIVEADAIERVSLFPDAFYSDKHRLIFKAIYELHESGNKVDLVSVTQKLKSNKNLEDIGGISYLLQLTKKVASAAHLEQWERYVLDAYTKRKFLEVSTELQRMAYDSSVDVEDVILYYLNASESVTKDYKKSGNTHSIKDLLHKLTLELEQRCKDYSEGKRSGITTGFQELDNWTNGWQNDWLIIFAGRPAMGKTAIAINGFAKAAAQSGKYVNIFSLEMSGVSLTERLVMGVSGLDSHKMRVGDLNERDWKRYHQTLAELSKMNLIIDDEGYATFHHIRYVAKENKKKGKCDLIIIDYLQLTNMEGKANQNRENEVSELSRKMKALAKELQVPIIALSQLSRNVESRPDKMPVLSDLRESGGIEQDADMVLFAYRPDYYGILGENQESLKGLGKLLVRKNRHGDVGDVKFWHNDSMSCFYDREPDRFNEPPPVDYSAMPVNTSF